MTENLIQALHHILQLAYATDYIKAGQLHNILNKEFTSVQKELSELKDFKESIESKDDLDDKSHKANMK